LRAYYDTGILLKLYTAEPQSAAIQKFVEKRKEKLGVTDLHLAECAAALRLKEFRKECRRVQASAALSLINEDLKTGVLVRVDLNWGEAWEKCRALADQFAAETGARTLDTLHVAAARLLEAGSLVTSDRRQILLARRAGLTVVDPLARP